MKNQKLIGLLGETIEYLQREMRSQYEHWTDTYLTSDSFEQWIERWCKEETDLIAGLREELNRLEDEDSEVPDLIGPDN